MLAAITRVPSFMPIAIRLWNHGMVRRRLRPMLVIGLLPVLTGMDCARFVMW